MGIHKKSILFLIIANIIWGFSFPIYKLSLSSIPPFTFVFLRFFLAAILILPFAYKHLKIEKSDIKNVFFRSLIGITIAISLSIFGLKYSSSINAPIILSSQPIILIIGAYFLLKEKIKLKLTIGTIVSLIGVLTIVLLPVLTKGIDGSVTGNLFFVLASIAAVIDVILMKKLLNKYSAMTITFWSFLIGSLPLLPLMFMEYTQTHWITTIDMMGIFGIFYATVLATVIGHYIYNYGMKNILASEVGIFTYVDPIATIILAVPLLHEVISLPYIIGSFLVFLGIFIAEERIHYHPIHILFKKEH
jgi:drug/metabolite transporter (DMT)-like permease